MADFWVIMAFIADIATAVFLLAGSFFVVVGGIGSLRFPDFFTRLHAGGITDTLGAGLILVGLMLQAGLTLTMVKLLMILLFLLATSPTACHALAHSALARGVEPLLRKHRSKCGGDMDDLSTVDGQHDVK